MRHHPTCWTPSANFFASEHAPISGSDVWPLGCLVVPAGRNRRLSCVFYVFRVVQCLTSYVSTPRHHPFFLPIPVPVTAFSFLQIPDLVTAFNFTNTRSGYRVFTAGPKHATSPLLEYVQRLHTLSSRTKTSQSMNFARIYLHNTHCGTDSSALIARLKLIQTPNTVNAVGQHHP